MTLEILERAMTDAMKQNNRFRKNVIAGMVDVCRKAAITPKGRIEITEELVNETLLKYSKMIKEMIDTCPASREELLQSYKEQYAIIMEYAPSLVTEPSEINAIIACALRKNNCDFELNKSNKCRFMKMVMPYLKGKVDMVIANKVIANILGE